MENLKVRLSDGFEFNIVAVNETSYVTGNAKNITIDASFADGATPSSVSAIEAKITVGNMSAISVYADDVKQYDFTGYVNNLVVSKSISKMSHSLHITANK